MFLTMNQHHLTVLCYTCLLQYSSYTHLLSPSLSCVQVIRSLKHAMQPAVTGAQVHFNLPIGYSAKVAPEQVPPIFSGERTIVYGILQKSLLGKVVSGSRGTVTLEGELLGEKIKHVLEFEVPGQGTGAGAVPTIHHLAGKALIKGLQNMESSGAKKDEIVKLSCECSVISKHTAFIAIDEEQKEPVKGSLQTWDVVAPKPSYRSFSGAAPGRGGGGGVMLGMAQKKRKAKGGITVERCRNSPVVEACMDMDDEEFGAPPPPALLSSRGVPASSPESSSLNLLCAAPPPPAKMAKGTKSKPSSSQSPQPGLPRIISLQLASGAWKLSAELAGLLGHSLEELKAACPAACEGELELVWATVLVLGYLEKKLLELQDEWELIAMKAKNWLKKQQVPEGHNTESFMAKAKTVV